MGAFDPVVAQSLVRALRGGALPLQQPSKEALETMGVPGQMDYFRAHPEDQRPVQLLPVPHEDPLAGLQPQAPRPGSFNTLLNKKI